MFSDFYKKIFKVIYEKFVWAFFVLVVLVGLVFFAVANIFLFKKGIDIEIIKEKSFQERFLSAYDSIEKNKKGTEFAGFLNDFFNLR